MQERRRQELARIKKLDSELVMNRRWFLVDTDWIAEWNAYINNRPGTRGLVSENPKIGVLPPGPISNNKLFTEPSNPLILKTKLKAVMHY